MISVAVVLVTGADETVGLVVVEGDTGAGVVPAGAAACPNADSSLPQTAKLNSRQNLAVVFMAVAESPA